jgi:antitoxin component HigA of HigAB toxin-antitoxin module
MRVQPNRCEADYDGALKEIAVYFERGTRAGLGGHRSVRRPAALIKAYEGAHWPIEAPRPLSP